MDWVFKMLGIGMAVLEIRNSLIWFSRNQSGRFLELPESFPAELLAADHYTCTDQRAVILYTRYTIPVPKEDRHRISLAGMLWSIGALAFMIVLLLSGESSQISCFLLTIAWVEFGTVLSIYEKRIWMRKDIYRHTITSGIVLTVLITAIAIWLMAARGSTHPDFSGTYLLRITKELEF